MVSEAFTDHIDQAYDARVCHSKANQFGLGSQQRQVSTLTVGAGSDQLPICALETLFVFIPAPDPSMDTKSTKRSSIGKQGQ